VIVNGHGAANHLITLDRLAKEYSADSGARVLFITAFEPDANGEYHIGHADALETSIMLAMYPEAVDLSKLPDLPTPLRNTDFGIVDGMSFAGKPTPDHTLPMEHDPRANSSAEKGHAHLQRTGRWIADQVLAAAAELGLTTKSGMAGE
jgi:creatinine amidohydrolase/Fe(II)-dependent formamide hydrolase-like protein